MQPFEKLKKLRIERGLTTYALAEITGISQSAISKMENNKRKLDTESILILSKALKVQPSYFFKDETSSSKYDELLNKDFFDTPEEAMKFILMQPSIMGFGGFDVNKMSEDEILDFANELLNQLKLISYKYRK